jgi:hypothetical protein
MIHAGYLEGDRVMLVTREVGDHLVSLGLATWFSSTWLVVDWDRVNRVSSSHLIGVSVVRMDDDDDDADPTAKTLGWCRLRLDRPEFGDPARVKD